MRFARCMWLIAVAGCTASSKHVVKNFEVFRSDEHLTVAILEIESENGPQTLIRVVGSMSDLNDLVLPHKRENVRQDWQYFETSVDGEPYKTVTIKRRPSGSPFYELWLPLSNQGIPLAPDPEATASTDPDELVEQWRQQVADGRLEAFMEHTREEDIAEQEAILASTLAKVERACGYKPELDVNWKPASEKDFTWGPGFCRAALDAITVMCDEHEVARTTLAAELQEVHCEPGDPPAAVLENGRLQWTAPIGQTTYMGVAKNYLLSEARWKNPISLARRMIAASTRMCTDGKSQYVGESFVVESGYASKSLTSVLFYGTEEQLVTVDCQTNLARTFFDPREYRPKEIPEKQFHSKIFFDEKAGTCTLRCGERDIPLKLVDQKKTEQRFLKEELAPPIQRRRPYSLARDRKGTYYFVDTEPQPDSKRFRIFVGPKGALEELPMINMVSDSNGEVFATESGSLRLVVEKKQSFWIHGKKTQELINLPLEENLHVIWSELGVYIGKPYGTPCDIF